MTLKIVNGGFQCPHCAREFMGEDAEYLREDSACPSDDCPSQNFLYYSFCTDCTMAAVNDDYTGLDYSHTEEQAAIRMKEIKAGLKSVPHAICTDDTDEFSWSACECCGDTLGGSRTKFVVMPDLLEKAL